jgi:manganese-dependent inorganic pyrophosphatase
MNEIFVTGHRNPDTDSVVAAMSYTALRHALGEQEYVAARLGEVNDETRRILDRFGMEPPRLVQSMRTQVVDLDFDRPPVMDKSVTMDRAWHAMREGHLPVIPVGNEDGTLYGMLSAGDIATYNMETIADPTVDRLPLFNLLSVLEGRLLNESGAMADTVSGQVTVALPQSCENLLFHSKESIVLCGNQPDMIRRALDIGVSCLILCQTDVDPQWLENAGTPA